MQKIAEKVNGEKSMQNLITIRKCKKVNMVVVNLLMVVKQEMGQQNTNTCDKHQGQVTDK